MSIDWTKPIRVRKTKGKAEVICIDLKNPQYPIVIRYFDILIQNEQSAMLTQEGDAYIGYSTQSFVENIPEMIEGYLNVCNYSSRGHYIGYLYASLKESKQGELGTDMIARIKICHPVGQFDE